MSPRPIIDSSLWLVSMNRRKFMLLVGIDRLAHSKLDDTNFFDCKDLKRKLGEKIQGIPVQCKMDISCLSYIIRFRQMRVYRHRGVIDCRISLFNFRKSWNSLKFFGKSRWTYQLHVCGVRRMNKSFCCHFHIYQSIMTKKSSLETPRQDLSFYNIPSSNSNNK